MGHVEHKAHAPKSIGVGLVTVSTSKNAVTDEGGPLMAELVEKAGHRVLERRLVKDDVQQIRDCLTDLDRISEIRAVLLSGGTGITKQDLTLEAITPLALAWLPGFGELFRQLSYLEIGSAAMMSRAAAAVCQVRPDSRRLVVAMLPGSPAAVRLALERLLLPELGHLIFEIDR
jgi:molybdopterin adenylyltransferase